MNLKDQKDTTSDTQVSPWYTNFLLPIGLIVAILLIGGLYFGYQSYSASKAPKLPTESPSNINYPQVSASGVIDPKMQAMMNADLIRRASRDNNPKLCEQISALEERNLCKENLIENEAFTTKSILLCEKLVSDSRKISCKNALFYNEAIATKNDDICNKITNNDSFQKKCRSEIVFEKIKTTSNNEVQNDLCNTLEGDQKNSCTERVKSYTAIQVYDQAQSSGKVGSCDNISDGSLRNTCKDQILIKQAESNKDTSFCNDISDSILKNRCIESIGRTNDVFFYREAQSKNDALICQKIITGDMRQKCSDDIYLAQAVRTQELSLCDKIMQLDQKEQCVTIIKK